jgi:hypothetical protein
MGRRCTTCTEVRARHRSQITTPMNERQIKYAAYGRKLQIRWARLLGVFMLAAGFTLCTSVESRADEPADPFPTMANITAWYTQVAPDDFFTADFPGVWFTSPSGLTCGIWDRGGFGCTGEIPGAPAGDDHIAWFNGNRSVHHGWTAAIQFPAGRADRMLPPRSYVTYNATTCATTPDGNTYCAHGEFKFLITPQGTWFKAWDDKRSYVCNFYDSCPAA